jgi:HPt (histidine-containing phosphotransfer) domain-containing protein
VDSRLEKIRDEFAQGLPQRMDRLRQALAEGEPAKAQEILHQLAGSSGIHGFMDLSDQAQLVYAQFKSGQLTVHSAELNRLVEIAKTICDR